MTDKSFIALAEQLIKQANSPDSEDWKGLTVLIREVGAQCPEQTRSNPGLLPLASKIAFAILAIAERTSNPSLLASCVSGLIRAGRFGRLLLCRYVRNELFPLEKLQAVVNGLPQSERMLLLHELLRRPQINSPKLARWADQILAVLGLPDPEEALAVLSTLGREGDVPSFAVHEMVVRGRIDEHITGRLKGELPDQALEDLVMAATALGHEAVLSELADHIRERTPAGAPRLFSTLARNAETGDEHLAQASLAMLKKTRGAQALLCVDTFMDLEWARTGAMMALFFKKRATMQRALGYRAILLPEILFNEFVDALSEKERIPALACAFDAIARFEPDFIDESLERERRRTAKDKLPDKALEQIFNYLAKRRATGVFGSKPTAPPQIPPMKNPPGREPDSGGELEGMTLPGAYFGRKKGMPTLVANCAFPKARFNTAKFVKSRFRNTDLTGAVLENCVFKRCAFKNVNFAKTRMDGCRFEICSFENCDFSEAVLTRVMLLQCALEHCMFTRALLHETGISFASAELGGFAGCVIQFTHIRSSRFSTADFSNVLFHTSTLQGVEFWDCPMDRTAFRKTSFQECSLLDCTGPGATMREVEGGPPEVLRGRAESGLLAVRIMQAEKSPATLPTVLAKAGAGFVRDVVERWVRHWDMARRERRMLINNEHRLSLAKGQLPPAKRPFFKMLPYLLHTDLFEQFMSIGGAPPCELDGYVPDYGTVALTKKFFPGLRPTPPKGSPLKIRAVYSIGSMGSMAQTPESDIDCWVCYDPGNREEKDLKAFRTKLDALTKWAWEEFGLEAYFFAMNMEDVRANNFGFADEESSGSAQALLLKEEFYRTAVRITGRNLLWWAVPPGVDGAEYRKYAREARHYPLTGAPRLEDLGFLAPAPKREFFGASLWQLVKGIKSPYKSVMKLGLLEKYSQGGDSGRYLCEQIKANIQSRRNDLRDSDPYVLLFKTLADHYHALNDTAAVELVRDAFRLKAAVEDIDALAFDRDASGGKTLPGQFGARSFSKGKGGTKGARPFARMLELGDKVNAYMLRTYTTISQAQQDGGEMKADIAPEDLTKLGRTVLAAFARKPHKVERNPFLDVHSVGQTELRFGADRAPGRKPVWWVKGKRLADKISRESMEPMKTGLDPAMIAAWLTANSLYTPESVMDAERTISPLVMEDFSLILQKLAEVFPPKKTFTLEPEETLKPERVVNVVFIPNLAVKRDQKKISTLTIIYNTNWGELFCRTETDPGPLFEKRPSEYLAGLLPVDTTSIAGMHWLPPKRCVCPRVPMV